MTRTWDSNGSWDFEIEDEVIGAIETTFRHINTFCQLSKQAISLPL